MLMNSLMMVVNGQIATAMGLATISIIVIIPLVVRIRMVSLAVLIQMVMVMQIPMTSSPPIRLSGLIAILTVPVITVIFSLQMIRDGIRYGMKIVTICPDVIVRL